jgi:hypothetical protein
MTHRGALALSALPAAAVLLLALGGCSAPANPDVTATVAETTAAASPVPTAPDPSGSAAAPACDTIVSESLVDTLTAEGWTFREEPFIVGDETVPDGLTCTWGDFTVASDHVQIFGWAPTTAAQQDTIRGQLLTRGWRLVEQNGTVYVTESAETAVATDDEGYGMTYQFGPGWIRFADTKQGLLLVEWPRD